MSNFLYQVLKISKQDSIEKYECLGFYEKWKMSEEKILYLVEEAIVYKYGKEYFESIKKNIDEYSAKEKFGNGMYWIIKKEENLYQLVLYEKKVSKHVLEGWIYNSEIEKDDVKEICKYVIVECQRDGEPIKVDIYRNKNYEKSLSYLDELRKILKERRKRIEE